MRHLIYLSSLLVLASAGCADVQWRNIGPGGGGWIQSIACDPRSADTLYVGCDVGGFYKSTDAGRSWAISNEGLTDYFIQCLAVSPQSSDVIVLGAEGGIFKSVDGGKTWAAKRQGFPEPSRWSFSAPIGALAFDPADPQVLYAGIGRPRWGKEGQGAIYRSDNCGETWTLATPPGTLPDKAVIMDLKLPTDGSYVLAATDRGLYRSIDRGRTWEAANTGLPHRRTRCLAISASNPAVVYCTLTTTARDGQPWDGGVYRSEDSGRTWVCRSEGLGHQVGKAAESAAMTSNYAQLAVDPRDDRVAYAGDWAWVTAGVYKTVDAGRSWTRVTDHHSERKNMEYGWITQWGPSVECLAVSAARPDRVVFGTSGHVFLTDNAGGAWDQRYTRLLPDGRFASNGLAVTCALHSTPDLAARGRWYFGFMDIGLLISEDSGETFRTSYQGLKDSGNCFSVAQDPADPLKLWAGTGQWGWNEGYVSRSTDGGRSWALVGEAQTGLPSGQVRSLVVDPASPPGGRTLYATCKGYGVYRSRDDGQHWSAVGTGLPEAAAKTPCRLLIDPRDPRRLLLALGGNPQSGSGLYESTDGASNWRRISGEAPFADLYDFRAAPSDFDTLYVCQREKLDRTLKPEQLFPGGLFKSTDGGRTWARVFDFYFTSCVAVHPTNPQLLYVGTTDHPYHDDNRASGVWKSVDGGRTWRQQVQGLSNWHISSLTIDPREPTRLFAGTGGNGLFVGTDK